MNKYVEIPKNDINSNAENAWFKTCKENNIPYITLSIRTKFADVHWDYITYPMEVDEILEQLGDSLTNKVIEIFNEYANEKSKYSVNNHLVWFKNLEIEQAKLAAADLHNLIAESVETACA